MKRKVHVPYLRAGTSEAGSWSDPESYLNFVGPTKTKASGLMANQRQVDFEIPALYFAIVCVRPNATGYLKQWSTKRRDGLMSDARRPPKNRLRAPPS